MPGPEARLSADVRRALELLGCTVYSTEAPRHRGPSGSTPGIPDLLILDPDRVRHVFAELKTGRGKLTPAQHVFADTARAAGLECETWRSVEDALRWWSRPAASDPGDVRPASSTAPSTSPG